ncbi:5-hydroxytryptamine receptor 1E-like [Physella acuta]|uniref:5-hydroxytryptamine receptor 1E-like n=1 Tax=Physella acuta TaxID=109671 RepID=UPI0027DDD40A|nr:5-hydroxytryptamine receptor 1E-like [Physella acuta]
MPPWGPWKNYTAETSNMPPWGPWRNYTAEASMLASQIDSNELPRYVIVAQTVIAVSSSLVNFIFLVIIFIVPEIRTMPSNLLLASLAVANLLFCSNVGLLQLAVQTHSHGENLCKTLLVLAVFTICLSCFSRCIIAIDRYYAISVPFKYLFYVSDFYAVSLIALVWTCSLGLACLPLLHWKKLVPSSDQCINHAESVPVVVMLVVVIMVPAVIMLFVYSSIFYWAYMQIRIIKMVGKHAG